MVVLKQLHKFVLKVLLCFSFVLHRPLLVWHV